MKLKTIGWCCIAPIIWELHILYNYGWGHLVYHYGHYRATLLCLRPLLLFLISLALAQYIISKQKRQKERKREQEKLAQEQKQSELKKAYAEISDIWNYGDKTMLAVKPLQSEEIGGNIHYVKLKYTNINSAPWVITINTSAGFSKEFKAKRKDNTLVGVNNDQIAIMRNGQLTIDDEIFYFSTKNEYVKTVSELIEELLNGKKVETIRFEHLKAASEDVVDALPKFHFSFTEKGVKCDEINYPQKHLETFFEKNNGGMHVFQNKVFYMDYCENNGLYNFDAFQEREFDEYMREMGMQSIISGYRCNTDFQLSEWQVSIRHGVEYLFRSFKSYVDKKTLDVVPVAFKKNCIYFQHKHYSPKKYETMLFYNLAIASMEEERLDKNPLYFISKTDEGRTLINIDGEVFISIKK